MLDATEFFNCTMLANTFFEIIRGYRKKKNKVHASQERIFIHLRHPRSNESKQVVYIDKIKYVDQLLRSPQHVSAEAREFEK